MNPLRVLIEAETRPDVDGGGEWMVRELIKALGRLDGPEQYRIVTAPACRTWLEPVLGSNQHVIERAGESPAARRLKNAQLLRPLRRLHTRVYQHTQARQARSIRAAPVEYHGWGDVLHVTHPRHYMLSPLPTVYTLHDIQHRALPDLFSREAISDIDFLYGSSIQDAKSIVTGSAQSARHILAEYRPDSSKMFFVHYGAAIDARALTPDDNGMAAIVDGPFVLYPALTYAHKNHARLLRAVAQLREEGLYVRVVCTGHRALHWPEVEKELRSLRLETQVSFPGYISSATLATLYRKARFVVFPSLFEGAGLPVVEALAAGAPLACSDLPVLREYGGEVPLYFDATSDESVARAVRRLWSDEHERERQRREGPARAEMFTWEHAARVYRAVYRSVAGRGLDKADEALLLGARP